MLQAAARKATELAEEEERKVMRFVAQMTGQIIKRVESVNRGGETAKRGITIEQKNSC
jgi:hypothetical protein